MKSKFYVIALFIIQVLLAQSYYPVTQYLLEKDFADNDNFLMPHYALLNEIFDQDLLWIDADSISNAYINPALLQFQTNTKVSLTFNDTMKKEYIYYYYPLYLDYASSIIAPQYYYIEEFGNKKPLLNLYAIKQISDKPVILGFAYNINWYKEEDKSLTNNYYPFFENTMISNPYYMNNGEIDFSNLQHTFDFLSSYNLSEKIALGMKASLIFGNSNKSYDYNEANYNSTDFQECMITEKNKLYQMELSSSAYYHDTKKTFGINGGWIGGKINQRYDYLDTLRYNYHSTEYSDYYVNTRRNENDKNWKHRGNSFFLDAIGSIRSENIMFLYRIDYLMNFTDVKNDAISSENQIYINSNTSNYYKNTSNVEYQIKGNGDEEYQRRSVAAAMRLYNQKSYISLGLVYVNKSHEKEVIESGNRYYSHENFDVPDVLNGFHYETKVVDTKISTTVTNEMLKIPVSLMLTNSKNIRFKTTLMKIFGSNRVKDNILADYKSYYLHTQYSTQNSMDDEHYKNSNKNEVNNTEINLYIEYDFYSDLKLFLSVYNYIDKMDAKNMYPYFYYDDDRDYHMNDWKFGVIYNF